MMADVPTSRRQPISGHLWAVALAPNVPERLRTHCCVADGIGDAGVTKEVLESPRVHATVGEGVTGRMAQHVNMDRECQLGCFTGPLDHASDAHAAKWLTALIDEHPSRLDALL